MRVVIVYGASWCGPCHMAQAHLLKRGVPFIDKDIEQDPGAERELLLKLRAIGADARRIGIPVIDVGGQMLFGYEPTALDEALAAFHAHPP